MQAIILAAGKGRRLKHLTADNTKCMIEVNGVTLIERALRQLDTLNLSRVVIVVGYKGSKLIDFISTLQIQTPIEYVENDNYEKTNNIYSLALARDYLLKEDTLLLESDIIFEEGLLESLIEDSRPTLAMVDKYENWMDGTCVQLDKNDSIIGFVSGKELEYSKIDYYYKTVNIYKFSKQFSQTKYIPFLEAYSKALGYNQYYEQVLKVITLIDENDIKGKRLEGQRWYEIDNINDLEIASTIFDNNAHNKTEKLKKQYGGYWRYPKMLDFCYLVNPYYPSKSMKEEMKANFETLACQYPSGMEMVRSLAAEMFDINREHIVVGNGAAEIIGVLLSSIKGNIGFIRPTFEEYPNRVSVDQRVEYYPEHRNFKYSVTDIMSYFEGKKISALILINPDNPSGNYIKKEDLIKLAKWCLDRGIYLILDESFVDFANEEQATMIKEQILIEHPNLIAIKSISKSYGVPGIRLGIMASADKKIIKEVRNTMPIWNINSFGEYFLQIADKYKKDYLDAVAKVKTTRKAFIKCLNEIPEVQAVNSQGNYIMLELTGEIGATELTEKMLVENNILIKDLSGKMEYSNRQFVRVAVREESENRKLIKALKTLL